MKTIAILLCYSCLVLPILSEGGSKPEENIGNGMNISLTIDEISCIRCLCHAITGCHSLQKCAAYDVSMNYWRAAGRPAITPEDATNETLAYTNCIQNDNCILKTVYDYTYRLGDVDCNCDNRFTCDDRFPIHYNACENLRSIHMFEHRKSMYQNCQNRTMVTRLDNCEREEV